MEASITNQQIIVAAYGNQICSAKALGVLIDNKDPDWQPVYLPFNPSGAHMGEVMSRYGIKKIAIYLDNPEKMHVMQYEMRLLRRLLPNRTKIIVGGAIHQFIGKFCPDVVAEAHDCVEDFLASLDQQLA